MGSLFKLVFPLFYNVLTSAWYFVIVMLQFQPFFLVTGYMTDLFVT